MCCKMGGRVDGFYQTGRELKEKLEPLNTPQANGLEILMIKVLNILENLMGFLFLFCIDVIFY